MDAIGLGLLVIVAGAAGLLLWQRRRWQRVQITRHRIRCPIHGDPADVAVATDPGRPACRQYLAVTSCSLRPDAVAGLPERVGYLWDGPPCKVRLEPAHPGSLYTGEVECRQDCVFVLNATAVAGTMPPLECRSGVSDAIGLAEQALGSSRMSRVLWYASL
jgi:hypothetical protein